MNCREVEVFVLFNDYVQGHDLQTAIKELKAAKFGNVFPLSVKNPGIGALILGVKEGSLDQTLSILNSHPFYHFVRFADVLPQKVDLFRPPSCSLGKRKPLRERLEEGRLRLDPGPPPKFTHTNLPTELL